MFEPTFKSVISIDTDNELIHFFSVKDGEKKSFNNFVGSYKAQPFSDDFYKKISALIKQYRENYPAAPMQRVSVVLSDSVALTDTINVPVLKKQSMLSSVDVVISNIYKGSAWINFNRVLALQNKQMATYSIVGIRREILSKVHKVCSDNQISVANITFASNSAVDGAFVLNPKLRNSSFVLLDIKDNSAKVICVVKGKTLGFYSLPFGSNILGKSAPVSENLLFNHSPAELLVLNAKEKAKAKALTMADDYYLTLPPVQDTEELKIQNADSADDSVDSDDEDEVAVTEEVGVHTSVRKNPRKLPKYMLRPEPDTREGVVFENFRFFVKWVLDLISSNTSITSLGEPEKVYVNMPKDYNFLFDMVNAEHEENGIQFLPLTTGEEEEDIRENLELYGGFYVKQFNKFNNFHATQRSSVKPREDSKSAPNGKKEGELSFKEKAAKIWKMLNTPVGFKKD